MRISHGSAWLFLALPVAASAQIPQEPLVRITVNLVQVEAVVTNRASAVVNVVDPRRVGETGITLENAGLAAQTGGQFVRNDNEVPKVLDEVLGGDEGYYLIGYTPQSETFVKKQGGALFRKLEIRVRGKGLKVRYRHGFLGLTDEETAVHPKSALAAALLSPFQTEGLQVKLTPVFGHDEAQGPFVTSLLRIASGGLTFSEEPDGARRTVLDTPGGYLR
jgi:hypothetical protein